MPADPNIFGQHLNPVRSMLDYSADLDRADANKLALEGQRRTNELAALTMTQQRQSAMQAGEKQNALRALLADPANADPVALENTLSRDPRFMADAQAMRKARLESAELEAKTRKANEDADGAKRTTTATAAKVEEETSSARFDRAMRELAMFQTPADAAAHFQMSADAGRLPGDRAKAMIASIPQDPTQFALWQIKMQRAAMSAKDQEEARQADAKRVAPTPTETKLGDRVAFIDTNPNSPTYGKEVAGAKIGQSADNAATNATSRANNAATLARQSADAAAGRGVQLQIAGMTDARAREQIQAAKDAGKPLNDTQAKALLFGSRMQEADKALADLEGKGVVRPGSIKSTAEAVAGFVPFIGERVADAAGSLTNFTQSADQQSVEQAQRDFVNAVLRRESGAAIASSEFENARKQYFPAVGDSEQVKKQKADNRQLAIRGLLAEVPTAHRESLSTPATKPAPASPTASRVGAPSGWSIAPVK